MSPAGSEDIFPPPEPLVDDGVPLLSALHVLVNLTDWHQKVPTETAKITISF